MTEAAVPHESDIIVIDSDSDTPATQLPPDSTKVSKKAKTANLLKKRKRKHANSSGSAEDTGDERLVALLLLIVLLLTQYDCREQEKRSKAAQSERSEQTETAERRAILEKAQARGEVFEFAQDFVRCRCGQRLALDTRPQGKTNRPREYDLKKWKDHVGESCPWTTGLAPRSKKKFVKVSMQNACN